MTSLPDNTNPTPFTNAQTWLLILASATLSVLALFRLDAKQSQLEDPKQAEVRHALQDATQRETVRQCLAEEPFVLVAKKVESTSSGNPESKNSKARIGEQLSLEDVADLFAKDPGWAQAHLENAARLAQCAYALNSLKDLRQPSAWEMAFTHGSSLNVVVRIARLILLGAFALCVSEAILRALKLANLPVIGLADIAKVMREGAVDRDPSQSAKVPGPLLSLIGTTLVTGITSATVVAPEVWRQATNSTQVSESRSLESRSLQATSESRLVELIKHVEERTTTVVDGSTLDALTRKLEAADTRFAKVEADAVMTRTRLELLDRLDRNGIRIVMPEQHNGLSDLRGSIQGLSNRLDSLSRDEGQRFQVLQAEQGHTREVLGKQIGSAGALAGDAAAGTAQVKLALRQRTCAMLAYFDDLERKRWLFPNEARARLQLMRDMMGQNEVTADCSGGAAITPSGAPSTETVSAR
jgi:hypothetical protein